MQMLVGLFMLAMMMAFFTGAGLAGFIISGQSWLGASLGTSAAWFLMGLVLQSNQ